MEKPSLSAIQGYFVASVVLMHLVFAFYYFSAPVPQPEQIPGTEMELKSVNVKVTTETQPDNQTEDTGPQPPEAGHIDIAQLEKGDDGFRVEMDEDWEAALTLDPALQNYAQKLLETARIPAGAIVAIDINSADVLALASRIDPTHPVAPVREEDQPEHLALRRVAPSASVFKIVSSASLLQNGLSASKLYPYRYAKRRITKRHLQPDGNSATSDLGHALATSNNGFFAAATAKFLTQDKLYKTATDFGFNEAVPFAALVEPSLATIPEDPLERARMAAGFWHSQLTPLHAASIAHTVAKGGLFVQPRLVKSVKHKSGTTHQAPTANHIKQVLSTKDARAIEIGLRLALTEGTATQSFNNWHKLDTTTKIYGKTGTLGARLPDRTYTWFVGYTKNSDRDIAIAVLAINGEKWWRKATHVAYDFLEYHVKRLKKIARTTL